MKTLTTAGSARHVSFRSTFGKVVRSVSPAWLAMTVLVSVCPLRATTQLLPGVYGYGLDRGTNSAGFGANSQVIEVTTLDDNGDDNSPLAHSLREALKNSSTDPRVIVFTKSGVINLKANLIVRYGNRTIAGQTAPWPGITLRGASLIVHKNNVLVQHLRIRPGDDWNGVPTNNKDAVRIEGGTPAEPVKNVVFDHCSFSWTTDEVASAWGEWDSITFNKCIFAEPLDRSVHIDEGMFTNNVPVQSDGSNVTRNYGTGVTHTIQPGGTSVGGQYDLVTGAAANDYADYTFTLISSEDTRDYNLPFITGIAGPNRARFRIKIFDAGGGLVFTSGEFDTNTTSEKLVNFISTTNWSIPGVADKVVQPTVTYRFRVEFTAQTGTNWQVGVDQIGVTQLHAMAPLLDRGGTMGEGKLAFTGSVIAHIRERGPWAYPKEFLFANNVTYNRTRYQMMLGHAAELPKYPNAAIVHATIAGNTFIDGKAGGYGLMSPLHNNTLHSSSVLHETNNEWDTGSSTPGGTLRGEFAAGLFDDANLHPISQANGMSGFTALTAAQAFNAVVLDVGARPAERDDADRRIMDNVAQARYTQSLAARPGNRRDVVDPAEWPTDQNSVTLVYPTNPNVDDDGNGYTRMEEWLQRLAAQVEGSTAESQAYAEPFAGTGAAANWTTVAGLWNQASGSYAQTGNDYPDLATFNNGTWTTNFSVSARLKTSWNGANNRLGIVYNYIDSANYSYVSFNALGLVELNRVTAGGSPVILATGRFLKDDGSNVTNLWFTATVRRRGDTVAVLVNGVPVFPSVRESGLLAGKVGLFTRFNATALFDDFTVGIIPGASSYFTDFEDGSTTGWTSTSGSLNGGTWGVELTGSNHDYRQSDNAATAPFAILDNSDSGDQSIAADVTINSFAIGTSWVGLVARYEDPLNYYYAKISGSTAEIKKLVNGSIVPLRSVAFTPSTATPYTVKLVATGYPATLTLYVNGQLQGLPVTDDSFVHGKAGLLMYRSDANYDNVSFSASPGMPAFVADDFNDGNDNGWTETLGDWTVVSQAYRQGDAGASVTARSVGGGYATDQVVEADVTPLNLPSGKWVGLMARYTDAGGGTLKYYYLKVTSTNVELKKVVGATITSLAPAVNYTVTQGVTYTLRLEMIGTSLRAYINDQLVVRANDTELASGSNGAGLITFGATADFDDVLVTAP